MKIEEMIAANRAKCSGCEACANICPKNAIEMTRDNEGFAYPKINPKLCIKCGRCDETCPALNFKAKEIDALPQVFAAIYKNAKILRHSSSGGIFSALSEIVLKSGGVVFGARFDENWRVVHTSAKNLDELENLRSSKYVQSKIGDVYRQVQEALKSKNVLFSGVPCQCVALKHFLGRDYENLLTVDIICHGVPSPALWENYIGDLGYAHEITHVNFRSKRLGWSSRLDVNFADKAPIVILTTKNLYGKLFLGGISERPSCHECNLKFPNNQSDLTLGDAWGVKDFLPEMYDNHGVSIVFLHTEKGKNFFEQASLKKQEIKFADAVKKNPRFLAATVADSRRGKFFAELAESTDWLAVMRKYNEDDEVLRKETDKENSAAFKKKYSEILTQVRKKFVQNILVISSVREDAEQKNLISFFEQSMKNSNSYFLKPKEEGQFVCIKKKYSEILTQVRKKFVQNILVISSVREDAEQKNLISFFEQSMKNSNSYFLKPKEEGQFVCTENFSGVKFDLQDTAALSDFVKQYNISGICVEKPLKLGDHFSSIVEWLKVCGLSVKFFAQKAVEN